MNRFSRDATNVVRGSKAQCMHSKWLLEIGLRRIEAPACATPGARVYVLLPALDQLLSTPGFGAVNPILLDRRDSATRHSPALIPRRLLH